MPDTIPEINFTLDPSETISAPVDTSLSIEGMAADAKAVGDALAAEQAARAEGLAAKADPPRLWSVEITNAEWVEDTDGGYSYEIEDDSVTANTTLMISFANDTGRRLNADLEWETSAGSILLTTAALPAARMTLSIIGWEAVSA